MLACTFYGHRDCPETIKPKLHEVLVDLITNKDVDMFYVGHQGRFDALVRSALRDLKTDYPQINYAVVLAYVPGQHNGHSDFSDTMLPEEIESVHPHFAIAWRNEWMLKRSAYVVTYVTHSWGGAAKFAGKARAAGKHVINI